MQFVAIFVIAISLIAIAYRDLKTALLSLAFILAIAMLFYFFSPQEKINLQLVGDVELSQSEISIGYAEGFVLNTRIHNQHQNKTLQNFLVRSSLLDCDDSQTECLTLGEEENMVKIRIPSGQARDVNINLRIKLLNPISGKAVWKHQVIGVGDASS